MVPVVDVARWDVPKLTAAWRAAKPFGHVVIDAVMAAPTLEKTAKAFALEPHFYAQDEIFTHLASANVVTVPELKAVFDTFNAPAFRAAVSAISGRKLSRADMRGYIYLQGHYLLPHTDHRQEIGRAVAYAFYVANLPPMKGGELELFDCRMRGERVLAATPAKRIAAKANRLVLFEVNAASLHQVREVTQGGRISLAGWFHPPDRDRP